MGKLGKCTKRRCNSIQNDGTSHSAKGEQSRKLAVTLTFLLIRHIFELVKESCW